MTTFYQGTALDIVDPLGDGKSKVELLWIVGDDLEVVNDARVSRAVEHEEFAENDPNLIKYMQTHSHWTPFAGSFAKFRIKMPLFIAREWYRHTVGLNRNEVSRRYVKSEPEFYSPTQLRLAPQQGQNKQGIQDAEIHQDSASFANQMQLQMRICVQNYNLLIQQGIAPEQARVILPVGTYTEFRESGSLAAYQRICQLRISPDAMLECRKYAEAINTLLYPHFQHSMKAQDG